MKYDQKIKIQARHLREMGHSIDEIKNRIHVAQSTVSLWVRKVILDENARGRIAFLRKKAREKGSATARHNRVQHIIAIQRDIKSSLNMISHSKTSQFLYCALLYWAEGGKTSNKIQFVNSDPRMIQTFLSLFRASYPVQEGKFRVGVHLHEYHHREAILKYWSEITNIPLSQFTKPYIKPHTKKNIRKNYRGCVCISYCDVHTFHMLRETYLQFSDWILEKNKIKY